MRKIRYRIEYAADKRRPEFPSLRSAIAFLRGQGYTVPKRKRYGVTVAYVTCAGAREAAKGGNIKAAAYVVPWEDPVWAAEREGHARIEAHYNNAPRGTNPGSGVEHG